MAESNKRKIADPIDLNDDDPFAELTRIMGFDPRLGLAAKPKACRRGRARRGRAAPRPRPSSRRRPSPVAAGACAATPSTHDDFGIDLEKELMGEFADFEAAPEAALPAAAAPSDTGS